MVAVSVELRNVEGTEAAMGWAGGHTIVIDRPEGKAGGAGLGFNGAQLLGLALGGCFCNDLRYVSHEIGVPLGRIAITVTVELGGTPLVATAASMRVECDTLDGSDPRHVIEKAQAVCTVANSLRAGLAVSIHC
ncbi:OsmC family protein [Rhizobium sp. Root482]|uniref:OsmC family protein n=1 Tax=Rhizobium sp. Root482 TaxID=1736543 RepID=UPI0006FC958F|nr:OsmC family protein [Rhizobium sp. Root482]KQY13899.1 oxidoreductase [Rhizobium sp. Root482]